VLQRSLRHSSSRGGARCPLPKTPPRCQPSTSCFDPSPKLVSSFRNISLPMPLCRAKTPLLRIVVDLLLAYTAYCRSTTNRSRLSGVCAYTRTPTIILYLRRRKEVTYYVCLRVCLSPVTRSYLLLALRHCWTRAAASAPNTVYVGHTKPLLFQAPAILQQSIVHSKLTV